MTPDGGTGEGLVVSEFKMSVGYTVTIPFSTCELVAILMSPFLRQDMRPLQATISTLSVHFKRFGILSDVPVIWCVKSFTPTPFC